MRAALFDRDERVLLVQEARDRRWTLPGGWADALDTPAQAAAREFLEEAGISSDHSLVALHDGTGKRPPYRCDRLALARLQVDVPGGASRESPLRSRSLVWMARPGCRFLRSRRLAAAVPGRTTSEQLRLMLSAHRDPSRPAVFD